MRAYALMLLTTLTLPHLAAQTIAAQTIAAQTIQVSKENRTLTITATGEAEALADLAAITIGFETFGTESSATYAEATRISNGITDALRAAGVQPTAIASTEQNLTPVGEDEKLRFAKGIRFRFSQSWSVTVPAASAAQTLHAAVLAGANKSGSIDWKLKDDDELEAAAGAKALTHARLVAERMATSLGSKLGPLIYASNQAPARAPFAAMSLNTESPMPARAISLKPLSISPEKLTRSTTVYAVFAIE